MPMTPAEAGRILDLYETAVKVARLDDNHLATIDACFRDAVLAAVDRPSDPPMTDPNLL